MACDQDTLVLISSYCDGETSPDETARAKAHLETCSECRGLVEQWRKERVMLEWAYSGAISDGGRAMSAGELARQAAAASPAKPRTGSEQPSQRRALPRFRLPNWRLVVNPRALAGAAAAIIVAFVVYHFATLPPMLGVGKEIAAANRPVQARIGGGIYLRVGPGSEAVRTGEKSVLLKKGWVSAQVRHGFFGAGHGLEITTPRLNVTDQGTTFQVGTGSKLDYVLVNEGSVSVSRGGQSERVAQGQVLMVQDKGKMQLAAVPKVIQSGDPEQGQLLSRMDMTFRPCDTQTLEWSDGISRLAARFPDLRYSGENGGGYSATDSTVFYNRIGSMAGIKEAIAKHFTEITQSMTTGKAECPDWEIPVALAQISGVEGVAGQSTDVFLVRLVCRDGKVFWRLTGSEGGEATYPLTVSRKEETGSGGSGTVRSLDWFYSMETVATKDSQNTLGRVAIRLSDWPLEPKPALKLMLFGAPRAELLSDQMQALAELKRLTAMTPGLDLGDGGTLLYLDPKRGSHFAWAWSADAGKKLCRLSDMAKQGTRGSALIGAFMTDRPLLEPESPAGVYIVRFVLQDANSMPRIDISPVGSSGEGIPLDRQEQPSLNHGYSASSNSLPGYGTVTLNMNSGDAKGGAFPFRISVTGRPDDVSTRPIKRGNSTRVKQPNGEWGGGGLSVSKP